MSATGGVGGMAGLNDLIGGWLRGGQAGGTVVGQENPEWDFPMGQDRVPDSVRSLLLRADAGPTGINQFLAQELQKNPKLIDEIRSAINMGVLRPKNAAAQNITTGYGGYRAGDMTALGPMINGMPSGLNENQLNTLANILNTAADYQIGLIEQTGYFDGKPTWQTEKEKEELAQGWKDRATNEFIAMETQRSNQATEGLKGEELTNQNIQKMAELFGGQMVTGADGQQTWAPTEAAQEFATQQTGYLNGQATMTREQQAFNQAKDVANLAANPRNYIEAQMLANSRGGLNGMAPNNQVQQTTFGPGTTAGAQQFQAPGGAQNQMQNWQTMLGNNVAQRSNATSAYGSPSSSPAPNAQATAQMPQTPGENGQQMDLNNPQTWAGYAQGANQQWMGAQQGMTGLNSNPDWANMVSSQQGYQQGGTTPGWQTPTNGTEPMMSISPFNPATGMRFDESTGQYTSAPLPTAQQNYATRMAAMGGQDGLVREQLIGNTATPEQQAQRAAALAGQLPAGTGARESFQVPNRGQDVVAANQGFQLPTSNFTQSLLQNRVVPKTGGLNTAGRMVSGQQFQNSFNPQKVRPQDYLRGTDSQQKGFNAVGSYGGYSDQDLTGIMKNNLPTFKAPSAGKMI